MPSNSEPKELDFQLDIAGYRERRRIEFETKLQDKRQRCIGNFSTGILCTCKRAEIIDHATEFNPNKHISSRDIVFGPEPTVEERYNRFHVEHKYYCDECGALYVASVIEGKRGYVPPDKLPDPVLS
jgi:hypothetical protein